MSRIVAFTEKQLAAGTTPPRSAPAPTPAPPTPAAPPPPTARPRLATPRLPSLIRSCWCRRSATSTTTGYPQPGFEWEKKISSIGRRGTAVSNATFEIDGVRLVLLGGWPMLLGQQARHHRPSPPAALTAHRRPPPTRLSPALPPPPPLRRRSRNPPARAAGRLSRLSSHVLTQRTFLPIFPAPPSAGQPPPGRRRRVAVDRDARGGAGLLILPSDLSPFAKPADAGVVAVSPGRLARMKAGGSYATIVVHPPAGARQRPPTAPPPTAPRRRARWRLSPSRVPSRRSWMGRPTRRWPPPMPTAPAEAAAEEGAAEATPAAERRRRGTRMRWMRTSRRHTPAAEAEAEAPKAGRWRRRWNGRRRRRPRRRAAAASRRSRRRRRRRRPSRRRRRRASSRAPSSR